VLVTFYFTLGYHGIFYLGIPTFVSFYYNFKVIGISWFFSLHIVWAHYKIKAQGRNNQGHTLGVQPPL